MSVQGEDAPKNLPLAAVQASRNTRTGEMADIIAVRNHALNDARLTMSTTFIEVFPLNFQDEPLILCWIAKLIEDAIRLRRLIEMRRRET